MSLDKELLEILRCPQSKQPLVYVEAESVLYCPASRLRYRIEEDVPVLLVEEAVKVDEAEGKRLEAAATKK